MVNLINLGVNAVKAIKNAKDKELGKDSSNRQEGLIKENKELWNYAVDKYNKFMDDRAQIREKFNTGELTTGNSNTDIATGGMSRVFDFIRDVGATVYGNPEVYKVDDNTIAKTAGLTGDNISYENISKFNELINNPKGGDLTGTVYQLVSGDTRMRQYMEAKYFPEKGTEGLKSGEDDTLSTPWQSKLNTLGLKINRVPYIGDELSQGVNLVGGFADEVVGTLATLGDIGLRTADKAASPFMDTQKLKDIDLTDMWKDFKNEVPKNFYDDDSTASELGGDLELILEAWALDGATILPKLATKPGIIGKIAKYADKFLKAGATESEAKRYTKMFVRALQGGGQGVEFQALSDLAEGELSPLEQYEMAAGAGAIINPILGGGKGIYEDIKSPSKPTKTSLKRLDQKTVNEIGNQAKMKAADKTLKTPTQHLGGEVGNITKNEVKPVLNKVGQDLEKIEQDVLLKNNTVTADDAINKINKILEDKGIDVKFDKVDINGKTRYMSSGGGKITQVGDKFVEEQPNEYINKIVEEINKIPAKEMNTAQGYNRVIKAIRKAGSKDELKKAGGDIVGKLGSAADEIEAPIKNIMGEGYNSYRQVDGLYSKIGKFNKDMGEVQAKMQLGQYVDPSKLKALEDEAQILMKEAQELGYELKLSGINGISDKSVVSQAAEKFYNLEESKQATIPWPSKGGAEKRGLEQVKNKMITSPEKWNKYAGDYTPSAWEQMFSEVGKRIPGQMGQEVSEFTYE